ncbi:MAG: hypothetical protein A2Y20_03630 [Firmicutes bacterium GWF2_51_9]|nr:MAG: hypothetical protein A2Y20_03630 [Firmicutes bacterium GWF2_51_9]OGS57883.1 MAG: hypothetical protein A2Y19_10430 [Firmicutes bacterium GWE2_51_13]HAM63918.1 hypothetical protein [Erysipelotrichaceae bacterium]
MMKNQEKARSVIASFTVLMLTLCTVTMIGLLAIIPFFLSQDALTEAMEKSTFSSNVYDEWLAKSKDIATQYGVDEEVVEGIVPQTKMEADIRLTLQETSLDEDPFIDTLALSQELRRRLVVFMESQELTLTSEVQAGIDELVDLITDDYIRSATIPYYDLFLSARSRIDIPSRNLSIILFLLIVSLAYFLNRLLPRRRWYRSLTTVSLSAGWIYFLIPGYLYVEGFYDRIQIRPYSIQRLAALLFENGLVKLIGVGFVLVLVGSILMYLVLSKKETVA